MASRLQQLVIPYTVGLTLAMAAVHAIIVAEDHRISGRAMLAYAAVAAGTYAFWIVRRRDLSRVRWGAATAHAITYLVVNGSFWLHALTLIYLGDAGLLDGTWRSILIGQSLVWGAFLLVHAWQSISRRGFEHARI